MPETGNSRSVSSNQQGLHEKLEAVVAKHRAAPFLKPLADFNRRAFDEADRFLQQGAAPLLLDSGCGVGVSTRILAKQHPEHLVIGVDRSADRLQRQVGDLPANALLVRADLVDFWRLALEAGWQPEKHFLLYPNPYPKKKDLKLRWHGHPVFPTLIELGGQLEARSNWCLYLEEMQVALKTFELPSQLTRLVPDEPLTPFERKYSLSGQDLWKLEADLNLLPRDDKK
ncbi:tRNA (guanine(46)-N(7))-methyltransferase TrmB [Marinospirillum perlucidum]|uniref:tRNA (guanine(46)-N(7))-methyltransferase TrmB n=1 Tax=Marinospirillum perlucidum TaxID=1982602 RepID=UPI000DF29BD7|nr:SAM-dependent methyltransferase [Marinospirillum perlucidum]